MVQIKFVKEIPIINGTYKKDTPSNDIGYQKWEVRKTYEVDMLYEITAKTKEEAEELLERKEDPKEEIDDYGDTFMVIPLEKLLKVNTILIYLVMSLQLGKKLKSVFQEKIRI